MARLVKVGDVHCELKKHEYCQLRVVPKSYRRVGQSRKTENELTNNRSRQFKTYT